jgi:hypothetical protein
VAGELAVARHARTAARVHATNRLRIVPLGQRRASLLILLTLACLGFIVGRWTKRERRGVIFGPGGEVLWRFELPPED